MIDEVAQRVQRAITAEHACDALVCPNADTLIAFAEGLLESAMQTQVAVRVAACPTCAAAVRVAIDAGSWADDAFADFGSAPVAGNVHELAAPVRVRRLSWLPLAMAAGLTMTVGVGVLIRNAPDDDTLRGSTALMTDPADGVVLTNAPTRLSWPCTTATAAARAQLLRADATMLWSGEANACGTTLPTATQAALVPGEYLWRVQDASGESLLGPYRFRIAP